jgi:predicted helicase
LNDKSAIEWIIERYDFVVDKDTDITNDPNTWSDDTRYIIDLLKRVVNVSMETMRIVKALPPLEIIK